ncbi:hypothetical protein [Saccharothrix sp. ST-888]|uniref:hypothetical protein n=1 Tax=Saccharothrix sp. ST-888 TaxID=1427391 RepID=UPI0005ECDE95|nr:hypothetical protein [Saccharothrix sp. ST-888]KJK55942.1 hypothetical protein UK12_25585 [Saccharothrix sp. ST-888]
MTSRTPSWPAADGTDPHPGIDLLADLAEDLTDPDQAPPLRLRLHLAECPECAETFAALAEVRDLLGAVETPPMPADIAARLDTALAAEAAARRPVEPQPSAQQPSAPRSSEPQPADPQPTDPQPTDPQPTEPRPAEPLSARPRVTESDRLSAPATPAESTAKPTGTPSAPPSRPAGRTRPGTPASATTGPGGPGRAAPGGRRRRRGRFLLGAAAVIAVIGLGGVVVQQNHQSVRADGASAAAPSGTAHRPAAQPTTRGTDAEHPAVAPKDRAQVFQDDQLTEQIHQLIAAQGTPGAPSPAAQPESAETPTLGGGLATAVPNCLSGTTGGTTGTPLAVGHGRYGTAEVTALVYPVANRPDSLDVYLVTPSCPGATVLLHRVVPAN